MLKQEKNTYEVTERKTNKKKQARNNIQTTNQICSVNQQSSCKEAPCDLQDQSRGYCTSPVDIQHERQPLYIDETIESDGPPDDLHYIVDVVHTTKRCCLKCVDEQTTRSPLSFPKCGPPDDSASLVHRTRLDL
jgi:hypothetical protein